MQAINRLRRKSAAALCLALLLAFSLPSVRPVQAGEGLLVHVVGVGRLVDGGQAVRLAVLAKCTLPGVQVLEAFVYITQDGHQSSFAGLPVRCGPRPRIQLLVVRVTALDFSFHRGAANASAYVLVLDPVTQQTFSASDTRALRIH